MDRDGFAVFPHDPAVALWAQAAARVAAELANDPVNRAENLRHNETWFVGVDLLPNAPDGAIGGVPLSGAWRAHVPDLPLHPAQLSIIYPGYPKRDPQESEANHRYRVTRLAAHVDGLLPVGPRRRRFAKEFHAYILSLPLTAVRAAPTVVWRGSHKIMQAALGKAIGSREPSKVDVTEDYHAARRVVFETCEAVPLHIRVGEAALIHRFALHGTDVWDASIGDNTPRGRMNAFFRPEFSAAEWLAPDPQTP
ncbi:MAG: hypothetical protein WBB25_01695 [Sulfitobacter sp.]